MDDFGGDPMNAEYVAQETAASTPGSKPSRLEKRKR
jgi:hypothetical protein